MSTKTQTKAEDINTIFNKKYAQQRLDDNVASIKAKLQELGYNEEYTNYIITKILLTRKADRYRRLCKWFPTPQDWGWKPGIYEVLPGNLRAYTFQLNSFNDFAMPSENEARRFAADNAETIMQINQFEQNL